ncbi:hypothetical protein [Glutamicibacter sp. AOP5-A2-18]|uniref:hypothetical protein n=1 Tax=Glutamicibacter sp. AOP5-A2-18 TaxID=3457656 RepID=UPI00403457D3
MSENGLRKIPVMRAALVAIQELHKPYQPTGAIAVYCAHCFEDGGRDGALYVLYPCETRKLADEGLRGEERD